jgi:hypothetical protein
VSKDKTISLPEDLTWQEIVIFSNPYLQRIEDFAGRSPVEWYVAFRHRFFEETPMTDQKWDLLEPLLNEAAIPSQWIVALYLYFQREGFIE